MAYSYDQLQQLAASVGVSSPVAPAVALAESGGDPSATHLNSDGSVDVGLWQINSVNWRSLGMNEQQLMDPTNNAKAMATLSAGGTNWHPWTTYTSGAYQKYMDGKNSPSGGGSDLLGGSPSTGPFGISGPDLGGIIKPFTDIAKALSFIFSLQFLYVVAGGLLVLMGLYILARQTGNAPPVTDVAAAAVAR